MMRKRNLSLCLIFILILALFAGCGGGAGTNSQEPAAAAGSEAAGDAAAEPGTPATTGGSMTLYYSHSAEWSDALIKEFQDKTGIQVDMVGAGTGELVSRMIAEKANPQGDVLWGGVVDTYEPIPELLEPYVSAEAGALDPTCVSSGNTYYGWDIEPMVIMYNTKLVSEEDAPKGWLDLLDPKFKGQIACVDPTTSSSSFGALMGAIMALGKDDGKGYEYVGKLVENLDGKIGTSSSTNIKLVADGEYAVGITYEEGALRYIAAGADMQVVYPEEGTNPSPSGIAVIKGCPNPENAKLFVDFILSKEAQSQLGAIHRRTARTDIPSAEGMVPLDEIAQVDYDLQWVAEHKEEFNQLWRDLVTQ